MSDKKTGRALSAPGEAVAWGAWAEGDPTRLLRYDGQPAVSHTPTAFYNVPLYTQPAASDAVVALVGKWRAEAKRLWARKEDQNGRLRETCEAAHFALDRCAAELDAAIGPNGAGENLAKSMKQAALSPTGETK